MPAPLFLAGERVDREYDAPVGNAEERAVCVQWRRFLISAALAHIERPVKAQSRHVRRVDLIQRAVACLARSEAIAGPFFWVHSAASLSMGEPYRDQCWDQDFLHR